MVHGGRVSAAAPYQYQIYDALSTAANEDGELKVFVEGIRGEISEDNSTMSPLLADQAFTGDWVNVLNVAMIYINITSDVASATDGLLIEHSADGGTTTISSDTFTINAGAEKTFSFQASTSHFRVMYTNGGSDQTLFQLQTTFKSVYGKPSSHRIQDSIVEEDDAELVKAVITGEDPNGVFQNAKVNNEAALSVTDFLFEAARGSIPGIKMFSIPGRKDSLSTSALDDLTQIPGTIVSPEPGGIQLEVVSSSTSDTSAGTGIQTLDLHYLDTSGAEQTELITLDGTTPVNTVATDIDFVQWCHAKTVGTAGVAVGNISILDTTGTTTYEYISAGGNQSLSARYKVPTGKTGYVVGWQASGITKKIDLRLRATVERFDRSLIPGVFLFQDILVLNDTASGYIPFALPLKMPAGAVVKMSAVSAAAGGDAAGQFDIVLVED